MDSRFLKLFVEKYAKKLINFYGIKIILDYVEDDEKPIKLRIENPNDLSFSRYAIEGRYFSSFRDFNKILGEAINPYNLWRELESKTEINDVDKLYISKETNEKLRKASKTIKTFDISYKNIFDYTLDLEVIFFEVHEHGHGEEIVLEVKVVVHNIYKSNEIVDLSEINTVFDLIYEYTSIPDAMYDLCSPMMSVITSEKTIVDSEDGFTDSIVKFYDTNGKFLI